MSSVSGKKSRKQTEITLGVWSAQGRVGGCHMSKAMFFTARDPNQTLFFLQTERIEERQQNCCKHRVQKR